MERCGGLCERKYLRVRGEERAAALPKIMPMEIPPRARRRATTLAATHVIGGNTSACAEKSRGHLSQWRRGWKYLRVRGEERGRRGLRIFGREIPPRARRRGHGWASFQDSQGNTSACAEKSDCSGGGGDSLGKYLRVRGEEPRARKCARMCSEIPPRARRRAVMTPVTHRSQGNTSACAEKSRVRNDRRMSARKYLRVRGEEASVNRRSAAVVEIPPRARRRGTHPITSADLRGNTSACAEKSGSHSSSPSSQRKYLRVRGEEPATTAGRRPAGEIPPRARRRDAVPAARVLLQGNTSACAEKRRLPRSRGRRASEIPPRARRRGLVMLPPRGRRGNTSACAEKSRVGAVGVEHPRKYLRVRGEERSACTTPTSGAEIPPRARRRATAATSRCPGRGNTSACAEKSCRRIRRIRVWWKYLRVRGEESSGTSP